MVTASHTALLLTGLVAACGGAGPAVRALTAGDPTLAQYAIAFTSDRDGNYEIYSVRGDGTGLTRLTDSPAADLGPRWSPDGHWIAFTSNRDGAFDLHVMAADGSQRINLTPGPVEEWDPAWSPDGDWLYFGSDEDGDREIYAIRADGTNRHRITDNAWHDFNPAVSPDGAWIAFLSTRDDPAGESVEIYRMRADGSDQKRVTHLPGRKSIPTWSPDGTEIIFTLHPPTSSGPADDDEIQAVRVADGSVRNLSRSPRSDEHAQLASDGSVLLFDSARDGDNLQLYVMNPDGRLPRRVLVSTSMDFWGSIVRLGSPVPASGPYRSNPVTTPFTHTVITIAMASRSASRR